MCSEAELEIMKIIRNISDLKLDNTIVTLGKFDGSHIGHRLLFDTAIAIKNGDLQLTAGSDDDISKTKKENDDIITKMQAVDAPGSVGANKDNAGSADNISIEYKTVIFTFDIHPGQVIKDDGSRTIQTHDEREVYSYPDGIDYFIEFPFNKTTMNMEPEDFVKDILVDKLGVKVIVVGKDFHFGRNRSGSVETLVELGRRYGFIVRAMDKVMYRPSDRDEEVEVSSTVIKEEIILGHMEDVTNMLGKPYSVCEKVLHGKHLGSTIGIPTINQIVPHDKILPRDGVYATRTLIDGRAYISITNVGCRPTFDDGEFRSVETFILDYDGDLYGRTIEVLFYKFIRSEKKFVGIDELKAEIGRNVIEAQEFFSRLEN